ncbi:MAG: hypothetical protein HQL12_00855 [Candidatus Omnitrophica bacterium]|nr:hypothetical protein [Candidatus Omnitrophota bacterium]
MDEGPGWWDYNNVVLIKERVNNFINENQNLNLDVKNDLGKFIFAKGMNKEQVKVLIGNPNKITNKQSVEVWTYSGCNGGVLSWHYQWGKLTFKNEILKDIEVKEAHYSCDL